MTTVDDASSDDSSRTHISPNVRSCGNFDIPEYGDERAGRNSPHLSAETASFRFLMTRVIFSTIVISTEFPLGIGSFRIRYMYLKQIYFIRYDQIEK